MAIKIDIQKPCQENWNAFTPVSATSKHCQRCDHLVVDFTKMSDREIKAYFEQVSGKVCGRFDEEQLKVYLDESNSSRWGRWLVTLVGMAVGTLFSPTKSMAQSSSHQSEFVVFKGKVINENKENVIGANVILVGSNYGVATDLDGKYELKIPRAQLNQKEEFSIITSFIGYESDTVILNADSIGTEFEQDFQFTQSQIHVLGGVYRVKIPLHKRVYYRTRNFFVKLFTRED